MPRIPNTLPSVAPGELPGVRLSASAPESAFGGGPDAAQAFGQMHALAQDAAKILQGVQEQDDLADVMKATSQLTDYATDVTFNPETGFLAKKGEQVRGLQPVIQEDWTKTVNDLSGGLKSDRQREMFQRQANERWGHLNGQIASHTLRERENYIGEQTDANIKSEVNAGAKAATIGDMSRTHQAAQNVEDSIRVSAAKGGKSPDVMNLAIANGVSAVYAESVQSLLANGQDLAAKKVFDDNADRMTENDKQRLAGPLKQQGVLGESQRQATKIMEPYLSTEGDKPSIAVRDEEAAITEARKIENAEVQESTVRQIHQRFDDKRRINQEEYLKGAQAASDIVAQHGTTDVIPPDLRATLKRTDLMGLEALAASVRKKEEPAPFGETYFKLKEMAGRDPGGFAKSNLWGDRGKVTGKEFDEVMTWRNSILNKDGKAAKDIKGFLSLDEMATMKMGIIGADKQTAYDFKQILNEDYVAWKGTHDGQDPNPSEMKALVESAFVDRNRWWQYGRDYAYTDTEAARKAVEKIQPSEIQAIEQALRNKGETPTRPRILELYKARQLNLNPQSASKTVEDYQGTEWQKNP